MHLGIKGFLVPWEVHVLDMAEQAALSSAGVRVFRVLSMMGWCFWTGFYRDFHSAKAM